MIEGFDNKFLQTFEYETTAVSDGNIIGTCELGTASIQLINESNNYSSLKGTWIKTIHGSFYIYNVEPVQEKVNIKLECYDIKYKLDKLYSKNKHTFPCSLKEWRNSIFEDCEVEYDNSDFPNGNLQLFEQPYVEEGASNRNVIQIIAQASASWVETDENDIFYFKWFASIIHEVKDWTELTTEKEMSATINTVVLGRGSTEDNVYYPLEKPSNPVEFRIDNNYILDSQATSSEDDTRYQNIIPIYNRIVGMQYLVYNLKSYRIDNKLSIKLGDKIKYMDIWGNELIAPIMKKKIIYLAGDVTNSDNYYIELSAEKLKETSTEFKYATSIKNDLIRVERKADKNGGVIEDLITKTDEEEERLTKYYQDFNEFMLSVKKTGTNNLLKNSVMFAYNDGVPSDWEISENGELNISSNTESITAGCVSGHSFTLKEKTVKQRVYVKADSEHEVDKVYYSFSTKIKKDVTGTCYVKIYNTNEEYKIELPIGEDSFYGSYEITALLPTDNYYDIELYGSEDSNATFTDNMFSIGEYAITWSQASGEIMNTQVNINLDGVLVKSSIYQGDYTIMSPLEFAGYSNINGIITKVFTLNKDTTIVKKLEAEDEVKMLPIKIVPITEGKLQGWAFVPSTGGGNK